MSLNITVNGKFTRNCGKQSILHDMERVKKELENERRLQRLQEVREESKNIARKIRNDVAEEKERQLRNLEAIKAKELECWREHVLANKNHDYRTSIFQVGTAHYAAKRENDMRASKERAQTEKYAEMKKLARSRKAAENKQERLEKRASPGDEFQTAFTQTTLPYPRKIKVKKTKQNSLPAKKDARKLEPSKKPGHSGVRKGFGQRTKNKSKVHYASSSESEDEDQENCNVSSLSECTSSDVTCSSITDESDDDGNDTEPRCAQTVPMSTNLCKTPAVVEEIDMDSNDSVTVITNEIKDKHVQNNRQFSRIIVKSPRKRTDEAKMSTHQKNATKKSIPTSNSTTPKHPSAAAKPSKRFTQISDLIEKTKALPEAQADKSPVIPAPPPSLRSMSSQQKPQSPRKSNASIRSSKVAKGPSNATETLSNRSSSGCVKFYDYNNRFSKEYPQPDNAAIHVQPNEQLEPNAMEQAAIEQELQAERQQASEKLRQKSEERGQKAIEREQVRRDCIELTEKLEALTRQYPQLIPTDASLYATHRFADVAARKEAKMNSAVEEILMRPAIITCPEIRSRNHKAAASPSVVADRDINLGAPRAYDELVGNSASSESCCSLLIGYVDDQRNLLRSDLNQNETRAQPNAQKAGKLKNLLERIEQLRSALCEELGRGKNMPAKGDNLQQVIDSLSDLRREHENVVGGDAGLGEAQTGDDVSTIEQQRQHRKDMQRKEAVLEQKLRELCKLQGILKEDDGDKRAAATTNKPAQSGVERIVKTSASRENPLEIVIKVIGDNGRGKVKPGKTPPRKLSSLIRNSAVRKPMQKRSIVKGVQKSQEDLKNQQNSYDSNSTSYRSLPPTLSNQLDLLEDNNAQEAQISYGSKLASQAITANRTGTATSHRARGRPLNPLIAHYVQRLLGMSRNSIKSLGVSSSEVETPSSSIVNAPANMVSPSTTDDLSMSQERLDGVQQFINENRSFIQELEESLRTQSDISLENSMRAFEDIWKQRLKNICRDKKQRSPQGLQRTPALDNIQRCGTKNTQTIRHNFGKITNEKGGRGSSHDIAAGSSQYKRNNRAGLISNTTSEIRRDSNTAPTDKADGNKESSPADAQKSNDITNKSKDKSITTDINAEEQIARYAKLTENCTQRIAELTQLINKVREEKQRLLEVTLSSVSDNGRNSTEYLDLPAGKKRKQTVGDERTSSDSIVESVDQEHELPISTEALQRRSLLENSPLEKNKHTGVSRDSGISMSRPMTALEQNLDADPSSYASSSQAQQSSGATAAQQRRVKPPATLRRFSPQLIEDEVAHELSTIVEVDTPATSRVNATTGKPEGTEGTTTKPTPDASNVAPVAFPTFRQYAQELNLDLTLLDPEQTIRIQHEFNELIACLKETDQVFDYEEFPSLTAYLQNLTANDDEYNKRCHFLGDISPENIEDLLACLRRANHTIRSFPTHKEYMKGLAANTPEGELIDTESLENITDGPTTRTETEESESLNIEEELKRRKILKSSFRHAKGEIFTSTVRQNRETTNVRAQMLTAESGIDKLSTSDNLSGDLERELLQFGMKWPASMRRKAKEAEALSSSTSGSAKPIKNRHDDASHSKQSSKCSDNEFLKETGRPVNLRDFLTKELLKHASSSSISSTEDSLRSQFLRSIIGSMTPTTTPRTGTNLERQKTSTPVLTIGTSCSHNEDTSSTSPTQLFSGESRLSSVHYHERSSKIHYEKDEKPDGNAAGGSSNK